MTGNKINAQLEKDDEFQEISGVGFAVKDNSRSAIEWYFISDICNNITTTKVLSSYTYIK